MKIIPFLSILCVGLSVQAMQVTEKDVPGKYKSSGENQPRSITLELKSDKSFQAIIVAPPKAEPKKSKIASQNFKGTWAIKDNTVILTSKKDQCVYHYKADLIFADGAEVGNGLECVDSKKKTAAFCFCLFEKDIPAGASDPVPTPTPKK